MRPPSKHGLEKKFKPWRKGKSDKKVGDDKRPTNKALKNRLRGQKRLLAKLENSNGDTATGGVATADGKNDKGALVDGVKKSITQLETDIASYEARELEKKNASKYHQVKFIERQKLTRLEKAIRRQLQKLTNTDDDRKHVELHENKNKDKSVEQLEQELKSIAMDQLYIAFHPMDMKYMALFQNGNVRVVDDERGLVRRRAVWDKIREELKKDGDSGTGESGGGDLNTKTWADFDAAKKALLSMPEDVYPNASISDVSAAPSLVKKPKDKATAKKANDTNEKSLEKTTNSAKKATASDGRFAISKELDGRFLESTTGADYQKEIVKRKESDSDGSDSSSSEDDDADPLKGFDGKKKKKEEVLPASTAVRNAKKQEDGASSSSAPSSSSSSSSSSSEDSSSDSDSSDSSVDMKPPSIETPTKKPNRDQPEKEDDDDDDFFGTDTKISTEDIFTQVQNENKKKKYNANEHSQNDGKGDKSRGFRTQNQSKKEYRDYQHREKRQKFG